MATITGDGLPNVLIGTNSKDIITGGGGDDVLFGLGDHDFIDGVGGGAGTRWPARPGPFF